MVSASEEMGVINVYAGGSKHQLQEVGRLLDRANQALQTLERYKVRLDDAIANLTGVELEDVVSLRDVVAVVQRGEMVHRIAEEIETMIIELGVDARLLRLQLDEIYGDIDDELDLVVADYLPAGRTTADTQAEMSRSTTTTCSTCASPPRRCTATATPPTSSKRSRRRACGCCTACTACPPTQRPRSPTTSVGWPSCSGRPSPTSPDVDDVDEASRVGDQGHARAGHRVDDPRPVQLTVGE